MENKEILKENEKTVKEFIGNSENRIKAGEAAFRIQQEFIGWFTIDELIEKFDMDKQTINIQLNMLMLFNMCIGRVKSSIPSFKIDLSKRVQRSLISEQISDYETKIKLLKEKLVKLD